VAGVVNINDVLDGHVTLDLERLDRVYLNAYVPNLQVGGQVVTFLGSGADNVIATAAATPTVIKERRLAGCARAASSPDRPLLRAARP
jgi:hypothetical protein